MSDARPETVKPTGGILQPGEKVIAPARSAWIIGILVGAAAAGILEARWSEKIGAALMVLITRGAAGGVVGAIVGLVMWRAARGQVAVIRAAESFRPLLRTGATIGLIIGTIVGLVNSQPGSLAGDTVTGTFVGLALGVASGALVWRLVRS